MAMQQQPIIENGTISEGANVSEIQTLAARVQTLTGSIDFWNNVMIWALVGAAIAATVVVLATRVVVVKAKQLTEAQGQLSDAKERQLSVELRDKDVKIAQAGKDASEANRGAAEANERATKAQASLSLAEQRSAEANAKAEGFRLDIAKANESSAKAEAKVASATAEAARANLELARLKTPRSLTNTAELINTLKVFSGTEFSFGSAFGDDESMELLRQIEKVMTEAGWKRVKQSKIRIGIPAVTITGKDDLVELGIGSGIRVGAESTESLETLQAMPLGNLPLHIRVASSLSEALLGHVTPPEVSPDSRVNIAEGSSKVIQIHVGKKP